MIYEMNLSNKYFKLLKEEKKEIEIRLNDEKRKDLKVGDKIIFIEENQRIEKLETAVIRLEYFRTFKELIDKYTVKEIASDSITKEELLEDLYKFYPKGKERKYGVVAIKLKKEKC